jgi:hypothetical protein
MLKQVQHKNKNNEHNSKKYDDVLYDDVHNVLHPIMLLPKAEDLIVVHIYFYKVPLVSHPKGLFL